MRRHLPYSLILVTVLWIAQAPLWGGAVEGQWEGTALYMEVDREISVTLTRVDGTLQGVMDVPEAGLEAAALSGVSFAEPAVRFELTYGASNVVFEGKLDGDSITGEYEYEGYKGTFQLKRKQASPGGPCEQE